jgi:hypothetical protein
VAAMRIQAGLRGYLARRTSTDRGRRVSASQAPAPTVVAPPTAAAPLSSPAEVEVAAVRIQAGLRGYLARRGSASTNPPAHSRRESLPLAHVDLALIPPPTDTGDPAVTGAAIKVGKRWPLSE